MFREKQNGGWWINQAHPDPKGLAKLKQVPLDVRNNTLKCVMRVRKPSVFLQQRFRVLISPHVTFRKNVRNKTNVI